MDLTKYTDEKLDELQADVTSEQERRRILTSIPAIVDGLSSQYLNAAGRESGAEWVQPAGAFDAYPAGWTATHAGKTWTNPTPGNVWEPPTNWREVVEPGAAPPEWVQPTGSEDAYSTGDQVTFNSEAWESAIDANTWSPANYPAGWIKLA